MFNRIHQKLGTASFIISIIALVAALGGGAYAASGGLTGKQKKEVEKIAKNYAGKPGAPGAAGSTGSTGPAGANGKDGSNGSAGGNGTNGLSVTTKAFGGPKGNCTSGGVEVSSSSPKVNVCNGTTGFTEFLPEGATETGAVVLSGTATTTFNPNTAITFAIPLEANGVENTGWVITQTAAESSKYGKTETSPGVIDNNVACVVGTASCFDTGCRGTAEAPTAPEGVLCVYMAAEFGEHVSGAAPQLYGIAPQEFFGYSKTGARLEGPAIEGTSGAPGSIEAYGTWAVTAPES